MAEGNSKRGSKEALFGTDGIRGIFGQFPITSEMAYNVGKSASLFFKNLGNGPILVGMDTRKSGNILEPQVLSGIKDSGLNGVSAGIIPTPALAYLVKSEHALAGVMISASHNPWQYNGFKLFNHHGFKLSQEDEKELENIIYSLEDRKPSQSTPSEIKGPKSDLANSYISFLKDSKIEGMSFKGIKVAVDCANGATYRVAPMVFEELGLDVEFININPDGTNINDGCGSEYIDPLKEEVLRNHSDIGLAFDGDGDRLIAISDKGSILNGDHIIAICARMFKEMDLLNSNVIVSTIMSNIGLTLALREMGLNHIRTNVGDRNVCEAMRQNGATIGGEESGHIIFLNRHTTGDGILSAIYLLCAMVHFNRSSSELSQFIHIYPQKKTNVRVNKKPPISEVPEIQSRIKEIEDLLGEKGRVVVRYSGTEPLCRIMVEGEDEDKIESYAHSLEDIIKKYCSSPI